MKRQARRRSFHVESTEKRVLRLSQETIRTLRSDLLANVVAGCNTTSWTTEHTDSGSAQECATAACK